MNPEELTFTAGTWEMLVEAEMRPAVRVSEKVIELYEYVVRKKHRSFGREGVVTERDGEPFMTLAEATAYAVERSTENWVEFAIYKVGDPNNQAPQFIYKDGKKIKNEDE